MGQATNFQINQVWEQKINKFSSLIEGLAKGNDDYYQEGILGLRRAAELKPNASDGYFVAFAKYAMFHYRDKGKSIDNGVKRPQQVILKSGEVRTYQRDMLAIFLNDPGEDFELTAYTFPPDLLAIDRVCAEKFYGSLNDEETEFIETCIELYFTNGIFRNLHAIQKLKISEHKFNRIKRDLKKKFIRTFGTDKQAERLNYVSDISPTALEI